ncbi:MAG: holo-ACP synthase [Clostridiales bacterium]|nr:holo-ACP synthase [Clostridiales bacterium]
MIKGIGTDILEIVRFEKLISNNSFMTKYYTEKERAYIAARPNMTETAAAMFCAKEAAAKAIGTGFRDFSPKDIEILHEDNGKPYIVLGSKAEETVKKSGMVNFNVSMSHCRTYATAFVTAEGGND